MKQRKKPALRFKGFVNDWEQRKLGDVFTSLQNNTLSRADLSDEGGLALDIHYGDILIKYGEFLDVSKERIPYLTNKKTIDKFKKSHLQNGDIVVSDTAEDETVGKCTEINGVTTQIVLSGLHTIPLRPVQRFAKGYFGSYLNSEAYHAQLKPLMQGIKVTSISKRAIQDTTVIYPLDLMEQEKIGQYFLSLDHLITLHQRKLEKLQNLKKAMLEKMFPKNGAKVPEIRFKGFTDDWEQRKLGDYVTIISGDAPSKFDEGNELYVKVDDLNCNSKYVIDSKNKVALHESINKAPEGSVVFPKRGAAIMTNKVRILADDCYIDTNLMALSSNKIDSEFLYNIISKEGLYKIADTSTIPQINNKHIEPYEVLLPRLDEQRTIGKFFKDVDNFITLHQRKLEKLQNLKKAMLERMFI